MLNETTENFNEKNEKSSIFESCNFRKGTSEFDSFYAAKNDELFEV